MITEETYEAQHTARRGMQPVPQRFPRRPHDWRLIKLAVLGCTSTSWWAMARLPRTAQVVMNPARRMVMVFPVVR
jgi:hypothetical protein